SLRTGTCWPIHMSMSPSAVARANPLISVLGDVSVYTATAMARHMGRNTHIGIPMTCQREGRGGGSVGLGALGGWSAVAVSSALFPGVSAEVGSGTGPRLSFRCVNVILAP